MTFGRPPLPLGLRVLDLDEHHGKAVFGPLLLVVWRKETTLAAFQRVAPLILELARAHPSGIGVMQLIEKGATPPDSATKREFLKVLSLAEGQVKHYSVVHEGSGFSAAIFRAVMSGVYTFARPKFPHRVFDSCAEAEAWHTEQQALLRPTSMTSIELGNAVQALRNEVARFAARPGER